MKDIHGRQNKSWRFQIGRYIPRCVLEWISNAKNSLFCFRPFPETTFLERRRCRGAVLSLITLMLPSQEKKRGIISFWKWHFDGQDDATGSFPLRKSDGNGAKNFQFFQFFRFFQFLRKFSVSGFSGRRSAEIECGDEWFLIGKLNISRNSQIRK